MGKILNKLSCVFWVSFHRCLWIMSLAFLTLKRLWPHPFSYSSFKDRALLLWTLEFNDFSIMRSQYSKILPISKLMSFQFSSVQSLSHVRLFATPWITARQASLSITNSRISLKFMSIESVMPSSHLILCCPLLLLPPIPPSIRVFSSESTLHMRWPKYWSFSFSIIPSKEIPGLISFRMDWLDL